MAEKRKGREWRLRKEDFCEDALRGAGYVSGHAAYAHGLVGQKEACQQAFLTTLEFFAEIPDAALGAPPRPWPVLRHEVKSEYGSQGGNWKRCSTSKEKNAKMSACPKVRGACGRTRCMFLRP